MKLAIYERAEEFLDVALQPLLNEEETNGVVLGISMRVRDGRKTGEDAPLFLITQDGGNRFCTLYTDLSNPASNKIHQNMGYRPVADCAMGSFDEAKE